MSYYFESLKANDRNDYLTASPKKAEVLKNANKNGVSVILPNSNNRAIVTFNGTTKYLQSYDTLILKVDYETRKITKLWDGYSVTTLKHVNEFLNEYTGSINTFNKKEWLAFSSMDF